MWRKATARRAPNVIEDLDEFDRNMGCVKFDAAVYATGVVFMHNRYSCNEMGEIAGLFERGGIPDGDITPKQPRRNQNPHRKLSGKGKIKYDPDDIGRVHLWIPFGDDKRWVTLDCANPDMNGVPVWLHKKCMEMANIEADEFCSREEQSVFRARLFDMIANVNEKASAKNRKLLGRALADKSTSASLRRFVELMPEDDEATLATEEKDVHPFAPDTCVVGNGLAGSRRKDATDRTPRPKRTTKQALKTWAQMQRAKNRGVPVRGRDLNNARSSKPQREIPSRRSSGRGITWKGMS
ncbi:hypothetical protein [Erythrobacter sp. QSSC1-22B]|uniref:hypothetical protein n=1 Tax=Erythrobacter sp. QSSC1-22B TaxID=1860125 RepID=UPI0011A0C1C9|nr:hypothetical protein [Erythrobacter sp. QSSC1-22B]